jgi:hypothetical protein
VRPVSLRSSSGYLQVRDVHSRYTALGNPCPPPPLPTPPPPKYVMRTLATVPYLLVYLSFLLTGTVLPDIAFYFIVYKFKSVLSVRPLLFFKLVYFVVLLIFKHTF